MSQASDDTIHNFMVITGTTDRENAIRFLNLTSNFDEAVNLFFESQQDGGIKGPTSPRGPPSPRQGGGFDLDDDQFNQPHFAHRPKKNTVSDFTEEEKRVMAGQKKLAEMEKEFREKNSGILGIIKPMLQRQVKGSGTDFLNTVAKFPISVIPNNLNEAVKYHPIIAKKKSIVVYVQKTGPGTDKAPGLDRTLFAIQKMINIIENNSGFTGVLDSSPAFDYLKNFGVTKKDSPCLLVFHYDKFGDLQMPAKIGLEPILSKKAPPAEVISQLEGIFTIIDRKEAEKAELARKLDQKREAIQNGSPGMELEDEEGPRRPNNPAVDKNLQMERELKKRQEEAYQRMIQQKREDDEKKLREEQAKANREAEMQAKAKQIEELKKKFVSRQINPSLAFELCIRLPNGKKIVQNFQSNDTVSVVRDFVSTVEDKGFEEPDGDFDLKSGFPPKSLTPNQTLEQAFPDGSGELITVVELFKSPPKNQG